MVVMQAQPDTAVYKALNPKWRANDTVELLRSIEYSLRWLRWAKSKQAQHGAGMPKPHYWPWERAKAAQESGMRGDQLTWEQTLELLQNQGQKPSGLPDPTVDRHRAFNEEG